MGKHFIIYSFYHGFITIRDFLNKNNKFLNIFEKGLSRQKLSTEICLHSAADVLQKKTVAWKINGEAKL